MSHSGAVYQAPKMASAEPRETLKLACFKLLARREFGKYGITMREQILEQPFFPPAPCPSASDSCEDEICMHEPGMYIVTVKRYDIFG